MLLWENMPFLVALAKFLREGEKQQNQRTKVTRRHKGLQAREVAVLAPSAGWTSVVRTGASQEAWEDNAGHQRLPKFRSLSRNDTHLDGFLDPSDTVDEN